jgi:hypothetical protein
MDTALQEAVTKLGDRQHQYAEGLHENLARVSGSFQQQLSQVAQHTELGKAAATPPSATGPPAIAAVTPITPPTAGRTPDNRRPRKIRAPRRDANGNIIVRLKDKPAMEYDEFSSEVKAVLRGMGIQNKADWEERKEKLCRFCGPVTDHYWSRCFKLFITTEKGQKFLQDKEKGIDGPKAPVYSAWAQECMECDEHEDGPTTEELHVFQVMAQFCVDNCAAWKDI